MKDGRTDEQRDESDFMRRCPTNVERSKEIVIQLKLDIAFI